MYNGMQDFGTGPNGPDIKGKWINRRTGNIINVRDAFISGDDMVVMTDKGQISMNEFSNNYIQASQDIYDQNGNIIGKEDISPEDIINMNKPHKSPQVSNQKPLPIQDFEDELTEEDKKILMGIKPVSNESNFEVEEKQNNVNINTNIKQSNSDNPILSKIFNKIDSKPTININIVWPEYPREEMKMLGKYFDINTNEIAKYIVAKYLTDDAIADALSAFVDGVDL
jgi:hypothetical protein